MFSASIAAHCTTYFRHFSYLNRPATTKTWHYDTAMHVVKHWRILFSPTILLLYDVTRGSPDDEFQEYPVTFDGHFCGVIHALQTSSCTVVRSISDLTKSRSERSWLLITGLSIGLHIHNIWTWPRCLLKFLCTTSCTSNRISGVWAITRCGLKKFVHSLRQG